MHQWIQNQESLDLGGHPLTVYDIEEMGRELWASIPRMTGRKTILVRRETMVLVQKIMSHLQRRANRAARMRRRRRIGRGRW
jgi:hypothetical protein